MTAAAILLIVTIAGGIGMTIIRMRKNTAPPAWFAVLHGLTAVAGLMVFLAALNGQPPDMAVTALLAMIIAAIGGPVLFILYFLIAASGGFFLFFLSHMKKGTLPLPLVLFHSIMAAITFITLIAVS